MDKKQRLEIARALSLLSQIGITIAACVMIGVFLGKFLDNVFGCQPLFLIIFSLLGAASAFRAIFTLTMKK